MKKGSIKNPQNENSAEIPIRERESSVLNPINPPNHGSSSNSLGLNGSPPIESANEKRILKPSKKQESQQPTDPLHAKLILCVRETFLEIRKKTLTESPNCGLIRDRTIPFRETDEAIMSWDPITLLGFIKRIFNEIVVMKKEAENEAELRNENECGEYEEMLRKLEAEVREHIKIEQQLKLYVESVQSKLEEQEKEGDISKPGSAKNEVENLKYENLNLNEKVERCKEEISNLKKRMNKKVEMIEKLEKQIENIPVLKKMVKEMDRVLEGEPSSWSMHESMIKGSHRSSAKDIGNSTYSNNSFYANDLRARKRSQPLVGSYSQDRNRESSDYIQVIDSSMQLNEGATKSRDSYKKEKIIKEKLIRQHQEMPAVKSSAKLEERSEEVEDSHKKIRKSTKSETNRLNSRERPDQEGSIVSSGKDFKAILHAKINGDLIEASKLGAEAAFKAKMGEYMKKSLEKAYMAKVKGTNESLLKKNRSQAYDNSRDKIENLKLPSRKPNAVKPSRPGTTGEKPKPGEFVQHSPEHSSPEHHKPKEPSSKRQGHDRSLSVEPKRKLMRQQKSRSSINEEEMEENHRKGSIGGYSKGSGKVNHSGSSGVKKSYN